MKWTTLLKVTPTKPVKGFNATLQVIGDTVCINLWDKTANTYRYFMNTKNYEHGYVDMATGQRHTAKLGTMAVGKDYYYYHDHVKAKVKLNKLDEQEGLKLLGGRYDSDLLRVIDHREFRYNSEMRERANERKWQRINALQAKVPEAPDLDEWIHEVTGDRDYCMYHKESKMYRCTACDSVYSEGIILEANPDLAKVRNKYDITCPSCGKALHVSRRDGYRFQERARYLILQNIDDSMSVVRHFVADIWWDFNHGRRVFADEEVRLFMYRNHPRGYLWELYYDEYGSFSPTNHQNRHMAAGYLYPDKNMIEEALAGTHYEDLSRVFPQLAAGELCIDYNRLMCVPKLAGMVEYLYKGGFKKLLKETIEHIGVWEQRYYGCLNYRGKTIEDVFGIDDRQKINRIRQKDGGEHMVDWLRWSHNYGKKLSDACLEWLGELDMGYAVLLNGHLSAIGDKMSPEQIMNYVEKQKATSYPGFSSRNVIEQWSDYLSMCVSEKKKLDDEMVYRPRELKRRHDEMVDEINKRRILEDMKRNKEAQKEKAKEMNEKFPGAEDILKEIKPKLEYSTEDYTIIVPKRLLDIMVEGQALHHCAGATDRYFDRIRNRETYICFLRKTAEPDVPYYTIEVEPSGTIRQHRGYLDEEPNIEAIRPFLKEWQKHIKTTLTKEDKEYAKKSKVLRQQNIDELKAKNNLRVLQGLMEDFMDAEAV